MLYEVITILFTATSPEAKDREQWVNDAVANLEQGLTDLGLEHWLKQG